MRDTAFSVPPEKIDRFATSYVTDPETGGLVVFDEAAGGQWSSEPAFPSGGGGLVSTADDFVAFGQMMLNHGKLGNERILSRRSVETMTTDQLTPEVKARAPATSTRLLRHQRLGFRAGSRDGRERGPYDRSASTGGTADSERVSPRTRRRNSSRSN